MTKNTDFILEKAFSEFLNSSYAEVSTNDLERATGLTRGAIYYTYKSKEELFRAVIERFVLDKQHVLRKTGFHEEAAKWISLKEYLEIYISGARNTIESMRRFVKEGNNGFGGYFSLLYQARRLFPDFDNEIHELFFREISFITAVVRNAVENGEIKEKVWKVGGLYGASISKIVYWLEKALPYAETPEQAAATKKLIEFYKTGDLKTFDEYSILWLKDVNSRVDFTNCFTESYGDPLGMKASWEAIVNFKDLEVTERTKKLSENAQWFEDHSPVDKRFKKEKVKGISAKVITAAILGGDLYPSTAIGINLPNSNWVRKEYGSKSVTIGNLTDAYNKAAHGNGFEDEFVIDKATRDMIDKYGDACDDLHTDLHECLGHGSGKLLDGVDQDTLKAYGSTIEEARADLFGLYYVADPKLVELGLTPNGEAYKSQYYSYMMNGLITQLVRIAPGNNIEEDHMRNRAMIAHWVYEKGKADKVVELVKRDGKTYVKVNDYEKLRNLFGNLLAEVQRIKSEGDYEGARRMVEDYGVKVDSELHKEVLARYEKLHLSPYKGFINPVYEAVKDSNGNIVDVKVTYNESYEHQMLRYSNDYATLPFINN